MPRRAVALLVVGLLAAGLAAAAGATTATFAQVTGFFPDGFVTGDDLNDSGIMVGSADIGGGTYRAIRRAPDGTLLDLGVLGTGTNSYASAINASGTVVGTSATTPVGPSHAFVWSSSGGMEDLGVLAGDSSSSAIDINAGGWIVGNSPDSSSGWVRDPAVGTLVDVGSIPGATIVQMVAINDAGVAIGEAFTPAGVVAFTWTEADGPAALPVPPGETSFRPMALGESGDVLGYSFDPVTGYRSFRWNGGFEELTGPAGYPSAIVRDINDRGVVVGTVEDGSGVRSFAVWDLARGQFAATVIASPVPDTIDAALSVVTSSGQLLGYTNEVVDDEDLERTFLGQLTLAPDPVTAVLRDDCSGPVVLAWTAPAFDGYGPVSYEVQRDGVTIATVTATTYQDTPHASTVGYAIVAVNGGGRSVAVPVSGTSVCPPPATTTPPAATPVTVVPRFTG